MGIKIEEVQPDRQAEIVEFFDMFTVNEFIEFFPSEMAQYASEHLEKHEHMYAAHKNGALVGAMAFTVQGGVGQLAAIQLDRKLSPLKQARIRKGLLRKFTDACKDYGCHLCFMWIPHQYVDSIKYYLKEGFERVFTARKFWYRNDYILLVKDLK